MLDPPKKVLFRPKQSTGLEDMRIDPQVNHPNVIGPWMLCGVGMDLFHARCRTGRESKPQKTCGRGEWEGSYMWLMASPKPFMGHLPKEPTIWPGLVTPCTTRLIYTLHESMSFTRPWIFLAKRINCCPQNNYESRCFRAKLYTNYFVFSPPVR